MKVEEAIENLKTKKRGFRQSYSLIVRVKGVDFKKPENKFSKEVVLPHGTGKDVSVGIFSNNIQGGLTTGDIEDIAKDKKKFRKVMKNTQFFICEAPLMVFVGKVLGKWLGPKGKMPRLLQPGRNVNDAISEVKQSVRIRFQSPVIHVTVGVEDMATKDVAENVLSVVNDIKRFLPTKARISATYIKLTMSPSLSIDV